MYFILLYSVTFQMFDAVHNRTGEDTGHVLATDAHDQASPAGAIGGAGIRWQLVLSITMISQARHALRAPCNGDLGGASAPTDENPHPRPTIVTGSFELLMFGR